MKRKLILISVMTVVGAHASYAQDFTLTTSASNITSSRASIGRPGLDGNPRAIIVATPLGDAGLHNPHPLGAWYYKDKWNIFNTDHVVMPVNMRYKIEYWATADANHLLHILTPENIGDDGSYLDHPLLNGHPNAYFKILQNYTPDDRPGFYLNANEAKAGYNSASGKWHIANVNGKRLYQGTAYSVAIFSDGTESTTLTPSAEPPQATKPVPTSPKPITQASTPVVATAPTPTTTTPANGTTACTKEMAELTVGKWGRQKKDDLAMADQSFPKEQHKTVLAKAQKVIELFKQSSPAFAGIEASGQRAIRGESYSPNGALPFRVDIGYGSYICVGNDTYTVEMRGKIILYGNYNYTTVHFNSLKDVLENEGFLTETGEEIYEYKKDLGEFKGLTMIEPLVRDEDHHEAVIITNGKMPYKFITREQYIRARIKRAQLQGGSFAPGLVNGLNNALSGMSPKERNAPAIVRDTSATPGRVKLFATEAEGGRHLVILDRSYFDPSLSRDSIQLITVHWNWNDAAIPKIEAVKQFKQNFDFQALKEMLGK